MRLLQYLNLITKWRFSCFVQVRWQTPTRPPMDDSLTSSQIHGHRAVKSLQPSYQGTSIFKSSEVLVNTHCLLELFQFCWLCHKECCITIEGNEKLFSVTQDCQNCGHHRDWRNHPPSAEPAETYHNEPKDHVETFDEKREDNDDTTSYIEVEHTLEPGDEDSEEVVVQIGSSDHEGSEQSYEQMFIETDGSYFSSTEEETSLQEEMMMKKKKKKKKKSKREDSSDEWQPDLGEEATDSDVSMDEDLFTALKEDGQGNLAVWCTQCGTEALLSCSVLRHKKVFCCAQCDAGGDIEMLSLEKVSVRFDDLASFQRHAEQEHGVKTFYKLCQECGKFVIADPQTKGLKEHKCEQKIKFIVCPECGKRFLTEVGLKRHCTKLHEDADHPCKYCLKVFKNRPAKLEHEQTHPKEKQPYSCPDCPEKFDNLYKRNSHVRSHRGPYKYLCDICEKRFKDLHRLRRHKLIHSGEKPFKCQVCERSFNQMENLTSHMRVHTGEKPFMCEQCGECFNHNVSLKNHKQRHHDLVLSPEEDETG
ncbi:zinc finger protein 454-like isoform X4 [Pangasianodon hypophthalmus]|uniref:zinc finger protein 454-like isoform X4 n=1 Tax=Pangasianodon hypophthalmus TaxID=310915 RepID=UPI002307C99D|nr:zinc finger protein 454-like isoform X4 [Pangasianodon hypophthalmus]XP_053089687.1 zinc finger protein 454-like isoform X4 [Pangasianodon hypophthalmus]XP_053089688.1 zinc finger protein 454-like isoform X4 [Pangasianodon hypophthalmus]